MYLKNISYFSFFIFHLRSIFVTNIFNLYHIMTIKNISIIASACLLLACACGNKTTQNTTGTTPVQQYQQVSPNFNADSAYTYVKDQVDFGYRVPNTAAHAACGNYLAAQLKRFGAEVQEQKMVVTAYDGTKLNARNIIGSYAPEKRTRILLFAHWDTRPYSDQDTDPANHRKPLLGANDGASGVGVLLEVARILQTKAPEVGIDIIFFDAEDYGVPKFVTDYKGDSNETWCLGSRYWAKNPHVKDYRARYGILLDMVGAPNAKFDQEYHSLQYAKDVVERVW